MRSVITLSNLQGDNQTTSIVHTFVMISPFMKNLKHIDIYIDIFPRNLLDINLLS